MTISEFLSKVEKSDIVSSDQLEKLRQLSVSQNVGVTSGEGVFSNLNQPSDRDDVFLASDGETPRLIRGFHDVLISIGIIAVLSGLWSFLGPLVVLIAIVILTEIFVIRQKLALPAFMLSSFFVSAVLSSFLFLESLQTAEGILIAVFTLTIALCLYYWRYKIPVTLALLISAAFFTVLFVFLYFLQSSDDFPLALFKNNARLVGGVALLLTACQFIVAMKFDLQDPKRITRKSDVAFWLHLSVAPLLMYSLFLVLFGNEGFWWANNPSAGDAVIVLAVVAFLMLIGIIIDRRAFVTSGLISLGVAFFILTKDAGLITSTNIFALSLLSVGVIVLLLGTGWQFLRKLVLKLLPVSLREKLPPITV